MPDELDGGKPITSPAASTGTAGVVKKSRNIQMDIGKAFDAASTGKKSATTLSWVAERAIRDCRVRMCAKGTSLSMLLLSGIVILRRLL